MWALLSMLVSKTAANQICISTPSPYTVSSHNNYCFTASNLSKHLCVPGTANAPCNSVLDMNLFKPNTSMAENLIVMGKCGSVTSSLRLPIDDMCSSSPSCIRCHQTDRECKCIISLQVKMTEEPQEAERFHLVLEEGTYLQERSRPGSLQLELWRVLPAELGYFLSCKWRGLGLWKSQARREGHWRGVWEWKRSGGRADN